VAIQQVLIGYGRTLDGRDAAGFAALFARDGVWSAPPDLRRQGPDAICEMIERLLERTPPSARAHYFTNMTLDIDGDRARAHSRFILVEPLPDGSPRIRLSGHYDDELIREDGRWCFAQRRLMHDLKAAQ
jgi:uncharacterized protein (TIGR02246 family)